MQRREGGGGVDYNNSHHHGNNPNKVGKGYLMEEVGGRGCILGGYSMDSTHPKRMRGHFYDNINCL